MSTTTIAALDVGGTSIKRGLVDLRSKVELVAPAPLDALAPAERVLHQLAQAVVELLGAVEGCSDLAVAFPQPFDIAKGVPLLRGAQKFDSIYGIPLAPVLRSGVGRDLKISFCGDAIAAAVGEAAAGAGHSYNRMLMVTIGTGFGSALTVAGQPVEEYNGCVVEEIHNETAGERGNADVALSASGLAELLGVDLPNVVVAAQEGAQLRVFEQYGLELGEFLARQAARFDPDVVVIGGGASGAFNLFGQHVAARVEVPVVSAALGQAAALLGAARLHGRGTIL